MKKWTYLVAAGMMLGAAPVFTGCIDNDEPEGITILRGAKAELLKAKATVELANAARIQAEASYIKAQEELVAAQAEIEKAKAEKIRKETELLAAKNEAEIAKIQAEIEILKQQAIEAEAKAQLAIKAVEAAMQAAEDAHNIALKDLAAAEAAATEAQWQALRPWRDAYDAASKTYFEKVKEVLEAQNELAKVEAGEKVSVAERRKAERALLVAQNKLKDAQAGLEKLNEKLKAAETLEPGAIPTEIENLNTQIEEKGKAIAMVEVEKQEAVRDNPAYAEKKKLEEARDEANKAEIAIAPFKNSINPDEAIYWPYELDQEIVEAGTYTLTTTNAYTDAYNSLKDFKQDALSYQLDADDVKWNEALINERTIQLEASKKEFAEEEKLFNAAVKAYNEGKGVDVTAYINYDKLVEAVNLYNEEADKLDAQKAVVAEKEELLATAKEAFDKATDEKYLHTPWNIYYAARDKANEDLQAAQKAANDAFENVMKPLRNKKAEALELRNQREKEQALAAANLNADPENKDLQKALENAEKSTEEAAAAYDKAEKAYNDAWVTENTKRNNAYNIADAQHELALQLARNNREKAIREWIDGLEPSYAATLESLAKAYEDAETAWNEENEKIDETPVRNAYSEIVVAYYNIDITNYSDFIDLQSFSNEMNKAFFSIYYGNEACYDLDINKLFVVTNAKDYLINRSMETYGALYADWLKDDSGWPGYRITPLDKKGADEIIATYYPELATRYYPHLYSAFGHFGQNILLQEVGIEIGKSFIANSDKFKTLIQDIDKAIAALDESYETQKTVAKEAEEAYNAKSEEVAGIESEFDLKASTLESEKEVLEKILAAYMEVPLNKEEKYTAQSIQALQKRLKEKIKDQEMDIYDAETKVAVKKDYVETLGQPDATTLDAAKFTLRIAELEQERAKELLDKAEEELNAAIATILGE